MFSAFHLQLACLIGRIATEHGSVWTNYLHLTLIFNRTERSNSVDFMFTEPCQFNPKKRRCGNLFYEDTFSLSNTLKTPSDILNFR